MTITTDADAFAAVFTALLAVPWMGWLLWDCWKHEKATKD